LIDINAIGLDVLVSARVGPGERQAMAIDGQLLFSGPMGDQWQFESK
jgi:hypothetical protein